jgi:FixJ family two-component response regulator
MQLAAATRSASKRGRPVGRAPGGDIGRLPVVAVVDDEDAVREAMEGLLRSAGFEAEGFGSAEAFLSCRQRTRFSCMILDIGLPGMSGLDLQQRLIASGTSVPIVFITAYDDGDRRMQAQALASGAAGFFRKPVDDEALLSIIRYTLDEDD